MKTLVTKYTRRLLTLSDEHRLKVFENIMLTEKFMPKRWVIRIDSEDCILGSLICTGGQVLFKSPNQESGDGLRIKFICDFGEET